MSGNLPWMTEPCVPCTLHLSSCCSALNMISVELTFSDLLVFDPRPTLVSPLFHFPPIDIYIRRLFMHQKASEEGSPLLVCVHCFSSSPKRVSSIMFGFYHRLLLPSALNLLRTILSPLPPSTLGHFPF